MTTITTINVSKRQEHYPELDSLRGLAAITVVVDHLEGLWLDQLHPASTLARRLSLPLAIGGNEAVILFFVLSGLVLALPAVNGRPQPYFTFAIRRVFRIYMPYLAALALSVAGAYWLHGAVTQSSWFHSFWSEPVDWHLVLQHVLFLGVYNTDQFNPPMWTLVCEMRISIIFPLLCAFALRTRNIWSAFLGGVLVTATFVLEKRQIVTDTSLARTPLYAAFFLMGIYLARERLMIAGRIRRLPKLAKRALGITAAVLFIFSEPHYLRSALPDPSLQYRLLTQIAIAIGASGVMVASMNSQLLKQILHWRPIHWLGEMSYSIYLLHFIILLYCVHLLDGRVPLLGILALAFILIVIVSRCSYKFVEMPLMSLGRRLSNLRWS